MPRTIVKRSARVLGVTLAVLLGSAPLLAQQPAAKGSPLVLDATLRTLMEELRPILNADKVLGQGREVKGVTIIPVASVGFGLGAGGGSGTCPSMTSGSQSPEGVGGGGGAGAGVTPEAILVVTDKGVELLHVKRGALGSMAEALAPVILEGIRSGLRGSPPEKGEAKPK